MLNPQRVFLENYRLAGLPWDLHQNHDAAWDSAPAAPAQVNLVQTVPGEALT